MKLDEILDFVLGTTNQAPPGAPQDVAIGESKSNPKRYNQVGMGKADKRPRMNVMKPIERDLGIQLAHINPEWGPGKSVIQAHHEQSETVPTKGGAKNIYGRNTPQAGQTLKPMYPYEKELYPDLKSAVQAANMRSGEVDFAAQQAVTKHRELLEIFKGLSGGMGAQP